MIRATQVRGQYRWSEPPADTVVLDFGDRHRRRMVMTGTRDLNFCSTWKARSRCGVVTRWCSKMASWSRSSRRRSRLAEIRGSDPQHLVRLAWHLGNRHLPTQITARACASGAITSSRRWLQGLGARIIEIEAPFDPRRRLCGQRHAHASAGAAHDHAGRGHSSHDHGGHHHHTAAAASPPAFHRSLD